MQYLAAELCTKELRRATSLPVLNPILLPVINYHSVPLVQFLQKVDAKMGLGFLET